MQDTLDKIKRDVAGCQNCAISTPGSNAVIDRVCGDIEVVMVGEAPGGHEVWSSGRPFSGQAGKLLEKMIAGIGLTRGQVYIANAVKCRPVKESSSPLYGSHANRRPTVKEREECRGYLERELRVLAPDMVVTLGAFSFSWFTGKAVRMSDVHGRLFYSQFYGIFVFSLYHPAGILYNRKLEEIYKQDLEKLRILLQKKGELTNENFCYI